jgi:hypothetical protein
VFLARLVEAAQVDGQDLRMDRLFEEFVASEAFQLRREEEVSGE